jgi:hypothetical protein
MRFYFMVRPDLAKLRWLKFWRKAGCALVQMNQAPVDNAKDALLLWKVKTLTYCGSNQAVLAIGFRSA